MTLRDLLQKTSYKSCFNEVYKNFYKNKSLPADKIMEYDIAYKHIFDFLISQPKKVNELIVMHVNSIEENSIDICFLDLEKDEFFSFDLLAIEDIIDLEIKCGVKLNSIALLTFILFEIYQNTYEKS